MKSLQKTYTHGLLKSYFKILFVNITSAFICFATKDSSSDLMVVVSGISLVIFVITPFLIFF